MNLGMMLQIDELSYIKIKTHMNKKTPIIIRVKRRPHNGKKYWLITVKRLVSMIHEESLQLCQNKTKVGLKTQMFGRVRKRISSLRPDWSTE